MTTSRRITVRGTPYRIDRQIGHGLHSLVYSGQDLTDGQPVAIKVTSFLHGSIDVKASTSSRRQSFWKEIGMLLQLQPLNPYIIRVLNYDYNAQYGVIIMERGETFRDTLVEHMLSGTILPLSLTQQYWGQMVESISYMHELGIVHGDVKPENFIQVGPDGATIKLIDMGISFQLPPNVTSRLKTATGTPDYVAPEMVSSRLAGSPYSRSGYKSDVWALGVILYEMAFGYRPLQNLPNNPSKLNFLGRLRRDINIPDHPNKKLRDVIRSCLRTNPQRRLTIEQVLNHPFLKKKIR